MGQGLSKVFMSEQFGDQPGIISDGNGISEGMPTCSTVHEPPFESSVRIVHLLI
jgi:hypothetical protein